jgi:hypothetical protein
MRRSTHTTLRRLVGTSVIVAATVIPASAAMAADVYPNNEGSTPPTPSGTSAVRASTTSQSTLPFTGGDVIGLAVIGAGAALAGTVLVRRSRLVAERP